MHRKHFTLFGNDIENLNLTFRDVIILHVSEMLGSEKQLQNESSQRTWTEQLPSRPPQAANSSN